MEIVVEKLGYGFGPWNVLGSHVALEHRRALGISGLAYVLHQLPPDQRIQDGITKALAGIFELSNVKQIPIPTAQSTGRTSLLEFSGGASAEPRLQPEKRLRKRVTVSRHRRPRRRASTCKGWSSAGNKAPGPFGSCAMRATRHLMAIRESFSGRVAAQPSRHPDLHIEVPR